jgi:hypothetical protein
MFARAFSGFVVPMIAVCTPSCASVNRSATSAQSFAPSSSTRNPIF